MKKQIFKKISMKLLFGILISILVLPFAMAVASFQVTAFSCSPSESVINSVFSCTSTIRNVGDAAGSVSTATLYPDSNNWLENSNYPQSSGTTVNPGETAEVTFTSLRAIKSGNNGFLKIMLDSVTDTYVADNNKKVNVINVVVTVSNSASSAATGASVTSTAEVTAGGNIDVSLTFTSNSGGCSIGSETNPKTISGMTDGSKQSRTWTITQGSSGDCQYTISAAATGAGGVASKIDSTSSTITCTNCPSDGGTSSSAGGGGGGAGGGGAVKIYLIGELVSTQAVELANGEKVTFNISGLEYTLTLKNHTETSAILKIKEEFTLKIGDEKNIDLNNDGKDEISIKLKSIDIAAGKVSLVLTPLIESVLKPGEGTQEKEGISEEEGELMPILRKNKFLYVLIVFFIILIIGAILSIIRIKRRKSLKWKIK